LAKIAALLQKIVLPKRWVTLQMSTERWSVRC